MKTAWALGGLLVIVGTILLASGRPMGQRLFRWLPVPLWCYALPLLAVTLGWLPRGHGAYRSLTDQLLPLALACLLLGIDLPAVILAGGRALVAAMIGAGGIVVGAPLGVWFLQAHLPVDAWKGAGALAGTWTGGTMNLLALRSILEMPDAIFAPLIIVDALVAYSWMAILVAASAYQRPIDRWLRATTAVDAPGSHASVPEPSSKNRWRLAVCALMALGLSLGAGWLAARLPTSQLVSSSTGWTILLVTTAALMLSLIPSLRRVGATGAALGYPCLYLVLAATGVQASLEALWSAPAWILVGIWVALFHGGLLLLSGRFFRIPLGMLATASQANIGGVVSAPLVGAVYRQDLAPIGLLLALAGNAVGTYLGLLSAFLSRAFLGQF